MSKNETMRMVNDDCPKGQDAVCNNVCVCVCVCVCNRNEL